MTSDAPERALILAPQGRDAQVAAAMLAEAGLASLQCLSIDHLVRELDTGAGFGLVTEEALRTADMNSLATWIGAQPEWSDFPFILLTLRGGGLERNPAAARHLETLGNVTFLERPFHPTTLVSLARSACRARRRQYDARGRLEELHALAASLERRVEERTAEHRATAQQLHEAQKLETLGQLTGGVAHDFNNLLTPIVGALDMLQRKLGGQDARTDRWLDHALQSAERAKTLVQRLLGFARRQELQSRPTDVAVLINGMHDLIASSIGSTIELRVDAAAGLPRAQVDPGQLELAILNLCVNARDAMPDGGTLAITVTAQRIAARSTGRLPPGDFVRLSVADSGTGMDAATLARAVEPFFSTKEIGRGTGLGLSMVHGLMAQLGGAFELHSAAGEGTRAELYMPATDGRSEIEARLPGEQSVTALSPVSVLLVDDEELVRHATAEMLRHLGHSVIEAEGGPEALALLSAGDRFGAVVTDYKMPRMDGSDLARRIRAEHPAMPILLISGYTGIVGPIDGLTRLEKPFGLAQLAAALAQVVRPALSAERRDAGRGAVTATV